MPAAPRFIYGGATIGESFTTPESLTELLAVLAANDIHEIDSAALYPPLDIGASERMLGAAGAIENGFKVNSKVMVYSIKAGGTLTPAKIEESVSTSRERLRMQDGQKLHILHAHSVDDSTPLEDQLAGFDAQYREGRFEKVSSHIVELLKASFRFELFMLTTGNDQLGVCNFPIEILEEIFQICDKKGYVNPTVYQGRYHLVARQREELFPLLRKYGMSFTAHSTLATGFLSGSLTSGKIEGTRFVEGNHGGAYAREKYDKPGFHDAIRALDKLLEPHGISKVEASLRWICYHSMLTPEDAIILGATKTSQVVENVQSIKKGPLPDSIVAAIDGVWDSVAGLEEVRTTQSWAPAKE